MRLGMPPLSIRCGGGNPLGAMRDGIELKGRS